MVPHRVPDAQVDYRIKVVDRLAMLALPEPGEDVRLWRSRVISRHLLPLTDEVGFMLDGGERVRLAALAEIAPPPPTLLVMLEDRR